MKKLLIFGLLIGLVFSVGAVWAAKPVFQAATVVPSGGQAKVTIPGKAVEVAPGVFSLGTALDVDGRVVEGYAFVDYKKGFGKPPWAGGGKKGEDDSGCFGFLAKGAKWKTTEAYVVSSNIDALTTARDLGAWDSQVAFNIFGNQDTSSVADGADTVSPDGKNEVMYGNISNQGVIAVAIVWGVFNGPPFARELVEWDVVFDNVDYSWGDATLDPTLMDFENIATHEFGHAAGMADLYEDGCSEQTMYGYANYGETKKRTLEAGDIKGVQRLYK